MRPRIHLASALVAVCTIGAGAAPPLKAVRWTNPQADIAHVLTHRPPECLRPARSEEEAYLINLGRAAFRTPMLLGGQAARLGLRCESCHRNGRNNPDFLFKGLSGPAGTADVTSFILSSHRGDHIDNPKPIPDLGGPKALLRIDQNAQNGALEGFIRGLVTEEFDGAPPPPAVLRGLAAYVRAQDPAVCAGRQEEPVTAETDLEDVAAAVAAAGEAWRRADRSSAVLMLQAARTRLGDIAERSTDPTVHLAIEAQSRALGEALQQMRTAPVASKLEIVYRPPRIGNVTNTFYGETRLRAALAH